MAAKLKPIGQQVIVITGATSGIGLATARMAAKRGAKLVIAARTERDLRSLEEEINQAGGEAIAVVADIGQLPQVRQVADAAIARFGGFDTWVNNAGVSIFGPLLDASDEDSRRLFETDFWGTTYGCQVAVEHLRTRGGAIINIGSLGSDRAFPLQGMYCAAKHAVKGYTDTLRMELEAERAPISVTLIKPASIDTPFTQHARNNMAEEPKLPPPVYAPDEVAGAILHAAQHPVRDIFVGGASKVYSSMGKVASRLTDRVMERTMFRQQKREDIPHHRGGSLHEPGGGLSERGNYPGMVRPSVYTRASMHPLLTSMIIGAAGAAIVGLLAGPQISRGVRSARTAGRAVATGAAASMLRRAM